MGIVISVYTRQFFHEYVLPPINNADYTLSLNRNMFGLSQDVSVRFEVIRDQWRICPHSDYRLYGQQEITEPYEIQDEELLRLVTMDNVRVAILFREKKVPFPAYAKYDISHLNRITIGKNDDCVINYDYREMVSGKHAVFQRQGNHWVIGCEGRNGLYLNTAYLDSEAELEFGDYINIIGLHMVFLGNELAIDISNTDVRINNEVLTEVLNPVSVKPVIEEDILSEAPEKSGKKLFHRAPRNLEIIDTGVVEIEAPPAPGKSKQQPLILTVGPSFTMAIPMLLGCLLMVYASRVSGTGAGLFMYSGLVMAVSSAIIGVIWALANVKYQKKTEQEEETHRFDAYSKYLLEKTEEIKQKYEANTKALRKMYPESREYLSYDENSPQLWNRNTTHKDFLVCRLGVGDIPFQVEIKVPQRRFSLNTDELANKPEQIKENFSTLYNVPILFDIRRHPLTGIVGGSGKERARRAARLLSLQIAACHCYTDVKLVYLYDSANSENDGQWEFAKWLPHVWSEDKKMRYVASNPAEISDVCYEITKILRQRNEERRDKDMICTPHFVIFLSDPALVEGELISKYIFDMDEKLGLSVFVLSDTCEHLPNACDSIIEWDENGQEIYNISSSNEQRWKLVFDDIKNTEMEKFSRRLADIEVQEMETGGEIPSSITFFEMYGVSGPEELKAEDRWLKNRTYDNIRGLIGQKSGGAPCYLDVHEKYHGPHGLVAGTTGSGKSETLQTYILSLALNYSPDDVGFFIIDYKGGGMAHLFDGLPHLVGQISNLSGNQIHRSMVSIKSENRRRQRIFNDNGVNNINAYTRLYKNKEASEPIPHLFIIIDEFAELKKEQPEFMQELISVAQVGRSLGVHLILATQKPSGTVDDNIWSNSKFRLCLRVQDKDDSMDMLHKPDAAYITQAGRCYLQVGNDEVYELFQSGWSGAPYDENLESGSLEVATLLTLTGRVDVVGGHTKTAAKNNSMLHWISQLIGCIDEASSLENVPSVREADENASSMQQLMKAVYDVIDRNGIEYTPGRYNNDRLETLIRMYAQLGVTTELAPSAIMDRALATGEKLPVQKEKTQLDAVIHYLDQTAQKGGYSQTHQLWLPVLPEKLYLDQFAEYADHSFKGEKWPAHEGIWDLSVVIGLLDDPKRQAQIPLRLSFAEGGSLSVIGSVVSGKSTFLQTLLFSLTTTYSPEYLNIYGIDFSNRMLSAFEEAPHVGGLAFEGEYERISKLFHLMESMLEERKKILQGGTYSQYVQVHGMTLPAVLLVIDNISAFREKTEDKYENALITLSKEGVSHGIFLVVTAGGVSLSELPGRIAENIRSVVCMEMPDRYAYADMLHTNMIDVLPETGVKGRGLALAENQVLEFQTALALEAEDDYQRMEKIAAVSKKMAAAWHGKLPAVIPEIPEKPVWSDFAHTEEVLTAAKSTVLLPVGYDEQSASIYSIDLRSMYCYLICGNARTGKRNFMKIMIQSARLKKSRIYVVDGKGDMNIFAGVEDVNILRDNDELYDFFAQTLTPAFQSRNKVKKELELSGAEEEELFEAASKETPIFIFISDLVWFTHLIYEDARGMSSFMENIIEKGRFHNIYFIGIMPIENGNDILGYKMASDFAGYHTGIHFGGNAAQNNWLNFDYLGYAGQTAALKPGIGQLPAVAGEYSTERVVVPLAKWNRQAE